MRGGKGAGEIAYSTCWGRWVRLCAVGLWPAVFLLAHVGSPDVFFQGNAGPYPLLVTIRPPDVIPGVARIEVRSLAPGVDKIELTPTPMTGIAATHPPVADVAQRVTGDAQSFEGALWLMSVGSWEVHIRASGPKGAGDLPVPVPAVAIRMQPMARSVSVFLFGMMVLLTVGMVAIVGAGAREAQLAPGARRSAGRGRQSSRWASLPRF